MTKAELIRRVEALEKAAAAGPAGDQKRLLNELRAQRIELETQNRDLREAQLHLECARDRYADLYDFAPVGFVTLDAKGVIREINLTAARMFGRDRARLLGVPFHLHVFHEDIQRFREHLRKFSKAEDCIATELCLRCHGDTTLPVLIQSARVRDDENGTMLCRTALSDISARKQAETTLRDQTRRYQSLVEVSPDAIVVLKHDLIEFVNAEGLRLFGAESTAQLLGKSPFAFFPRNRHEVIRHQLGQLSPPGGVPPLIIEELLRLDGSTRWVTLSSATFTEANKPVVQVILRDITDRRRLESELLEIADREQRRIGHDLHDGLGQQLAALEMRCFLMLDDLEGPDFAAKREQLQQQARLIGLALRECITSTRSIARGLAPVVLKTDGLMGALEQLALHTRVPGRIECQFACPAPVALDNPQVAKHLYRIAQEAVANALKHGRTRRVHILLEHRNGTLRLQIKDDGRGLPASGESSAGMGLEVMRHRAQVMGASLKIISKRGQGVTVTCTLPLET